MEKAYIYSCIELIENELKKVLSNNPNAEVIIHEIVTDAFMLVHDFDNSSFTDEEIAKKTIRMSINSFYEARHIINIIDKFNNHRDRVFYGLRGRSCCSKESLLKSIDILKKDVRDERRLLLLAVDKVTIPHKPKGWIKRLNNTKFKWLSSCVTIAVIAIAGMIMFVPDNSRSPLRYGTEVGEYVYIDDYGIVHVDRRCSRLNYKGMASERKPVSKLSIGEWEFCPKCVSDKAYEIITNKKCDD